MELKTSRRGFSKLGIFAGVTLLAASSAAIATGHAPALQSIALPSAASALPDFSDLPQETAEPVIAGPATASCTVTLMLNKQFRNTAYPPASPEEPDRNFHGTYAPPAACPGPWAKVVLDVSTNVSGDQFDRLLDVYLGGALFLSSSTSEPCCSGKTTDYVHWTAQRDVSQYAALLSQAQPVSIDLGNVVDSTYTGIYVSTATLTFYETGASAPGIAHSDFVTGVHSGVDDLQQDGYYQLNQVGQIATQPVSFPRNLIKLEAELFAQGHGACEEFWWGEPGQCGVGTPYREVAVYVDGQLAGAAPVYPVTFTGAGGPGFWEPIPAPRAWNLRPYRVDLSPFVGTLTDGAIHQVGLAVLDASYPQGDVWDLAANLFGWTDKKRKQTVGALNLVQAPPAPVETSKLDPSGNLLYTDQVSHTLEFSGWVGTSAGRVTTRVHESMHADSRQAIAAGAVKTSWNWKNSSTAVTNTVAGVQSTEISSDTETYGIDFVPEVHVVLSETRDTTATDGRQSQWTAYRRSMETSDATGIVYDGASTDHYRYSDSTGVCVDHAIAGLAGFIVSDTSHKNCLKQPAD